MGELDAAFPLHRLGQRRNAGGLAAVGGAQRLRTSQFRAGRFLVTVGRRKFLVPLYAQLSKTPEGKQRAKAIYAQARPNYHSVATSTLDELLK
jgi:hypothetical protein